MCWKKSKWKNRGKWPWTIWWKRSRKSLSLLSIFKHKRTFKENRRHKARKDRWNHWSLSGLRLRVSFLKNWMRNQSIMWLLNVRKNRKSKSSKRYYPKSITNQRKNPPRFMLSEIIIKRCVRAWKVLVRTPKNKMIFS